MKATTGIRISLGPIPPAGASEIIRIDKQEYDDFPVTIPALDRVDALPRTSNAGVAHAMATSTNNRRNAILGILVEQRRALAERHGLVLEGSNLLLKAAGLTETATDHEKCFRAEPKLWTLGQLEAA